MGSDEYLEVNRAHWDERAPAHARSSGYAVERFVADPGYLSAVVRFDRPRLGDIAGLDGIHLQCHIGTDTVSLARLGARMTGLDLSPASLAEARTLAERTGTDAEWVESDVYGAPAALAGRTFDLVYTGIGALCWLPDVRRWAEVVDTLLRPGGALFIREGHPMMWAVDDRRADDLTLGYPYSETPEPWDEEEPGTYVDTDVEFGHNRAMSWNHGLGETITALLDRGLTLTTFVEHQSVPWDALPGRMTHNPTDDEWRLTEHPERLPLTYTVRAEKRG
ncbi:MAG: class I SAM-dependent methyltransferase [Dermatophilaceae bacterium]